MGTEGRVPLGRADRFDRTVAQREVHLPGRPAGGLGREAGPREEALGDPVMSSIFLKASKTSVREPTLATEPGDQFQLFERAQMRQSRWGPNPQSGRDVLQARPTGFLLPSRDDAKRLHLTMGELLKSLHEQSYESTVYIGITNY